MIRTATASCLFSAPFSFLGELQQEFRRLMPTAFREIWKREELAPDPGLTAWVVNPGQQFRVDAPVLEGFPALSVLVTPSTGNNHLDLEACRERGVSVYSLLDDREGLDEISASAEFTFLLLLNTLRRLDLAVREVSEGRWRSREEALRGQELRGKQVGILGLGRIGRRIARYCAAFGARVATSDPHAAGLGLPSVSLRELFSQSDILCICCSLTPQTDGLVGAELLNLLKPGACLVNSSRGEVIVEHELAEVLERRPDLRVGLDVLSGEALGTQQRSPLLKFHRAGRIVITPHVAGATVESQTQAARIAYDLLRRHLLRSVRAEPVEARESHPSASSG
jgi:lactate dehydrogenase-like 2-hydroxyacid dehydrogenase